MPGPSDLFQPWPGTSQPMHWVQTHRGRGGFYKPGEGITLHMPPLQQPKAGSEELSPAGSPQLPPALPVPGPHPLEENP